MSGRARLLLEVEVDDEDEDALTCFVLLEVSKLAFNSGSHTLTWRKQGERRGARPLPLLVINHCAASLSGPLSRRDHRRAAHAKNRRRRRAQWTARWTSTCRAVRATRRRPLPDHGRRPSPQSTTSSTRTRHASVTCGVRSR